MTHLGTLISLGNDKVPRRDLASLRAVNLIALIAVAVNLCGLVFCLSLGWTQGVLLSLSMLSLYCLTLCFSQRGWQLVACVQLLTVGMLQLLLQHLLYQGEDLGMQYWLLVIPVFAAIIFPQQHRTWKISLSLMSVLLLGLMEYPANLHLQPHKASTDALSRTSSAMLAGLVLMLVSNWVRGELDRVYDRLGRLNRRLGDSLDRERDSHQAKTQFLAQMSHELRTPLNGILGICENLVEGTYGQLEERQLQVIETIDQAGRHQLELINDLLDLSRLESGGFEPVPEWFSVSELCEETLRMLQAEASRQSLRLRFEHASSAHTFYSDRRRIQQMLLNLLGNAIKFTPQGGEVLLRSERREVLLMLQVRDTGIGIPPEQLDSIFELFTQLDSRQQRKHTGTGMGLNLTWKLAEALGGSLEVESELGRGSCFTIQLPLPSDAPPAPPKEGAALQQAPWSEPEPDLLAALPTEEHTPTPAPEPCPPEKQELHILLVDDTAANIIHVRDFLESMGHRVSVAENGHQAVALAQELPDIIFMDVQMPELDGLEATRRIRAAEATAELCVIMLSALAMPAERQRCLEAGADDYLTKPVSIRALREILEGRMQGAGGS